MSPFKSLHYSSPDRTYVLAGTSYRPIRVSGIKVKQIHLHPESQKNRNSFSFCLIELKSPIPWDPMAQVAVLPRSDEKINKPGTNFFVAGWGLTGIANETTTILHMAKSQEYPRKSCVSYFPPNELLGEDVFCLGYSDKIDKVMEGDEGAPFFDFDTGKVYGMVIGGSHETPDDLLNERTPLLGLRIASARKWIGDTLRENVS